MDAGSWNTELQRIAVIAFGGALGSVTRYLINISPLRDLLGSFPLPTFLINVSGSFLIGFLLILFTDKWDAGDNVRFGVLVGFLGAFTTFSTFELEIWTLIRDNHLMTALAYLGLSVFGGLLGVAAGIAAGKAV